AAGEARRRCRQRLAVPPAQDRHLGRAARGAVGEHTGAGQRPDGREVARVAVIPVVSGSPLAAAPSPSPHDGVERVGVGGGAAGRRFPELSTVAPECPPPPDPPPPKQGGGAKG